MEGIMRGNENITWTCEHKGCEVAFKETHEWYDANTRGRNRTVFCPKHREGAQASDLFPDISFEEEFERRFPTISLKFIKAMNDVGMLGREKYGDDAVESRAKRGKVSRAGHPRIYARAIAEHAANHFSEYLDGVKHDVYDTRGHQLAAAAFNPMMEFMLAELGDE